jgi:glycerol-3-phosphate dehydrogenase
LSEAETVDLLIVGGGINGAGIARDAAGRGLKVVLCEQDDLANHTSSASSKLIHGGLRYLEQREFRLVRKALIEREILLRIAPHIIRPLPFILPHSPEQRSVWLIRLGLFLYNHLGGRKKLPRARRINLRRDPVGVPLKESFRTAFAYPDCWVEDARLVVLNALDARERGAEILTRTRCTAARRANALWYAELTPTSGPLRVVRARALVNATGPWVSRFLVERTEIAKPGRIRLVKGSHIVVPRLYHHGFAYTLQHRDGRILFVLPYEERYSLIGTTDVDYQGDPCEARITQPEIVYLCDVVSRYFRERLSPDRVVSTFAGVRPLYDDAETNVSAVTRDYAFDFDQAAGEAPLLSIYGGKITTYRRLAEHALEKLQPVLGCAARPWTAKAPLPGGDLPQGDFEAFVQDLQRRARWLPSDLARRYARAYGSRITKLLGGARALGDLGERLGDGVYEAELEYLRRHEWAVTAEDILWRRSRLGLHVDADTVARLESWLGHTGANSSLVRASTRGEIEPFGAVLGRRLQAALSPGQGAPPEREKPAEASPSGGTVEQACLSSETEGRAPSSVPEPEAPQAKGRLFERLRAATEAAAASGVRWWGGIEDTSTAVLPLDFSKTFVSANATHYDECWRLMEWRDRNRSWNWAAALTLGGWLAYRRLYGYALLHSVWLGLLLLLAVNGAWLPLLAALQVAVAVMLGLYGNALYRRRFRKAATNAAQHDGDHSARLALLAVAGGVDSRAPWIMGLAMVVVSALIVRFGDSLGQIRVPL